MGLTHWFGRLRLQHQAWTLGKGSSTICCLGSLWIVRRIQLLLVYDSTEFEGVVSLLYELVTLAVWWHIESARVLLSRISNLFLHLHLLKHLLVLLLCCTEGSSLCWHWLLVLLLPTEWLQVKVYVRQSTILHKGAWVALGEESPVLLILDLVSFNQVLLDVVFKTQ